MTQENRLISSDNKGYAAIYFEKWKNNGRFGDNGNDFVASFAQSESGDVSPNINSEGTELAEGGFGPTLDQFENTRIIGERQLQGAQTIYQNPGENLSGSIRVKHQYVDLQNHAISHEFTGVGEQFTCNGALGFAFAAGAEDGPGPSFFSEGDIVGNPFINLFTDGIFDVDADLINCQAPKPILIATGNARPHPWTPNILPFSLVTLGNLAIINVPVEVTTMAARRLKNTVLTALNGEVDYVVIAALTNHYSGYVTTFEEYQSQQYEGGHNIFGPWTLAAYQEIFTNLSIALLNDTETETLISPDLSEDVVNFQPGVILDSVPRGEDFGSVEVDVEAQYQVGETVIASFWTGHPKNNLQTEASYCVIEKLLAGEWVIVADDSDWETQYQWQRVNGFTGTSLAHCHWQIPETIDAGTYRIQHAASYKRLLSNRTLPFTGTTSNFIIER